MGFCFDVIVIGGGHAGIEAVMAVANMGKRVALITEHANSIGHMPCNPSIGGSAKGIVVREIVALGGVMGKLADESLLQIKMLNKSKGPAVWSLRAQVDIVEYPKKAQELLNNHENVTIVEKRVDNLIVADGIIKGVHLTCGTKVLSEAVIVTAGTYMDAVILIGHEKKRGGPNGFNTSGGLSKSFKDLGFDLFRLKTGTPARVRRDSLDYTKMAVQPGDEDPTFFTKEASFVGKQLPCYLTYAAEDTIAIITENLDLSAMYSGNVQGVGPRYCPSIEDKVVRFSDKQRHQVFIEPESLSLDSMYVQGMSTSMPPKIQLKMLRAIKGLEQCEVIRYGYAIEYDALNPTQLLPTLETKTVGGLFTAGQINGTSGYEEAAAQGLIAGINAVNKIDGNSPLVLRRDESYIGVMIDDLVTKGTKDPYRLLTSRAEYRLLLRHDNAEFRLHKHGHKAGLISTAAMSCLELKTKEIERVRALLQLVKVTPIKEVLAYLVEHNLSLIHDGLTAQALLRRPEMTWIALVEILELMDRYALELASLVNTLPEVIEQVTIQVKYEGYIKKALAQVESFKKLEYKKIPMNLDYQIVPNLALEAIDKLTQIMPLTLGQASRIAGVNAIDITMLDMYLKMQNNESK
ncbi:MAG: tRNA uridine-5-carboxymethylaminomethyl(34) synthesis enzyme MnmG [Culicoidibacterales bacterium]